MKLKENLRRESSTLSDQNEFVIIEDLPSKPSEELEFKNMFSPKTSTETVKDII